MLEEYYFESCTMNSKVAKIVNLVKTETWHSYHILSVASLIVCFLRQLPLESTSQVPQPSKASEAGNLTRKVQELYTEKLSEASGSTLMTPLLFKSGPNYDEEMMKRTLRKRPPTADRYPESSPVSPCSILGTTHTLKK